MKKKKTDIEKCVKKLVKQYFKQTQNPTEGGYLHAELIARVERKLIQQVLKQTQHNQCQAAKILGISRTTLRKKMAEYQLAEQPKK